MFISIGNAICAVFKPIKGPIQYYLVFSLVFVLRILARLDCRGD